MQPTTDILLKDGKFYRRQVTYQDLGAQERILASFAESNPVFVRNYQMLGQQPMHLLVNRGAVTIVTEISKLPFDSNWIYDTVHNTLVPAYNNPIASGSVKIDDPWIAPPSFGKLLFVVSMPLGVDGTPAYGMTYLYRYFEKELYWFPYPNLFENCKVCMGREFEGVVGRITPGTDALSIFLKAHTSFFETRLNSDLTKTNTARMFARKPTGEWIYHTDYRPFCAISAGSHMRGLAL